MNNLPDVGPHIFVTDLLMCKQQTDQSGQQFDENSFFLKNSLIKELCN